MSDNSQNEKDLTSCFLIIKNSIIKKIIPLTFGLLLWSGRFRNFVTSFALRYAEGISYLEHIINQYMLFIIFILLIIYGYYLKNKFSNWYIAVYIAKIIFLPIYFLYMICLGIYNIYISLKLFTQKLFTLSTLIILSVFIFLQYFIIWSLEIENILYYTALISLPLFSLIIVAWLYKWHFSPMILYDAFKDLINFIIEVYFDHEKDQLNKHCNEGNKDKLKKLKNELEKMKKKSEELKNEITVNNLRAFLTNIFVLIFLYISALVILNFSFSFYGLYKIFPQEFLINIENPSLVNFIILSIRTLFFNDYHIIRPISLNLQRLIIVQSVCGIFLFVILIMIFSSVSVEKAKDYEPKLKDRISKIISRIDVNLEEINRELLELKLNEEELQGEDFDKNQDMQEES